MMAAPNRRTLLAPIHHSHVQHGLTLWSWTAKRSANTAFTPLSLSGLNETYLHLHSMANGRASVPPSALLLHTPSFTSPYTSDGVQRARPLLPGQQLPMGVAAVAMAMPLE